MKKLLFIVGVLFPCISFSQGHIPDQFASTNAGFANRAAVFTATGNVPFIKTERGLATVTKNGIGGRSGIYITTATALHVNYPTDAIAHNNTYVVQYFLKYPAGAHQNFGVEGGTYTPGRSLTLNSSNGTITLAKSAAATYPCSAGTLLNHNNDCTPGYKQGSNRYTFPTDRYRAPGFTHSSIDSAQYYFKPGSTNQYKAICSSYINGISGDVVANDFISAMLSFIIQEGGWRSPLSATLAFNNIAFVNNPEPDFHTITAVDPPLVRIRAGYTDESLVTDPVVVYVDPASNRAFNKELDALKLMNTDMLVPNLYAISSDSVKLSIYAWPGFSDTTDMIPLGLYLNHDGYVTFSASDMQHIPAGKRVYLYDIITGNRQDLQINPLYRVPLEWGWHEQRFFLVLRNLVTAASIVATVSPSYSIFNNGTNLYVQVTNLPAGKCVVAVTNRVGQVLLQRHLNSNGLHNLGSGYTNGIYIVTFYTQRQQISKKVFIAN